MVLTNHLLVGLLWWDCFGMYGGCWDVVFVQTTMYGYVGVEAGGSGVLVV